MAVSIDIVARTNYTITKGGLTVNKTISMSIRVSEEELEKLKEAANVLEYSSYSEFVRRTALMEARRAIHESQMKYEVNGGESK